MMKSRVVIFFFLVVLSVNAQKLHKVEPPIWWTSMEMDTVEFMVYGEDIHELEVESKTLNIIGYESLESSNYLFVTAHIPADAIHGQHRLNFKRANGKKTGSLLVEIRKRKDNSALRKGFSSADIIYLLMPDRFSNGNTSNDNVNGMMEKANRSIKGGRHGGDIAGVAQHLDYFKDLGISALWLNPVVENDMPDYSYHGYAMTDLYTVDARYGSNQEYADLSAKAKEKGIGLIMDQVANHIGSSHPWMQDLPSKDWVNQWPSFTETNHMKVSRFDPHAAKIDQETFFNGWFVETMPDLNQQNPKLARYLIQNSIWWIEYLDLYGIRMDTWSYPDKEFLANWTKAILTEYPKFNIVGEEWVADPNLISYWQHTTARDDDYESFLPSVMDFPLQTAITGGLKGETGWRSSMAKIYESLANDYMYGTPNNIMIFPDNHDMDRIFTQLDEDFDLWKMAMSIYFTMRGTLQMYYGTEILMTHTGSSDHGDIRADFPGGWKGDTINAFTGEGLSPEQLEAQEWIRTLAKLRRNSCALNSGELLHYIPKDEVYVYFRTFEQENVMVVANRNEDSKTLDLQRFSQGLKDANTGENLITKESIDLSGRTVEVGPMETLILWIK